MKKPVLLLIMAAVFAGTVSGQTYNATDARQALMDAQSDIQDMEDQGIPVTRVNNLLIEANQSYRAQKTLAENGGNPDYSRVQEITRQIEDLQDQAVSVNDQLEALEMRLEELNDTNIDLSEARNTYRSANESFHTQRFEEAENRIETAYSQISEAQSVSTQVEAFASAQRQNLIGYAQGLADYAVQNWKKLSVGAVIVSIIGIIGYRRSRAWILASRMERLKSKQDVLEGLIREAQEDYFVRGLGSKISFETRMDRFEQMQRSAEEEINTLTSRIEKEQDSLFYIGPDYTAEPEPDQEPGEPVEERKFSTPQDMVENLTVTEVKQRLRKKEEPDYLAVLEAEEDGPGRVTLQRFLRRKLDAQRDIDYDELVDHPVDEVKKKLEKIDHPDYGAVLDSERENRNRVTLKRYLRRKLPEYYEPDYDEIVAEHTVSEVKQEIEEMKDPSYEKLLKAEERNRDRKTLKEYLEKQISG